MFALVAIDDVYLWMTSSSLMAIILLVLIMGVVIIFLIGGKPLAGNILNNVVSRARSMAVGATTTVAAEVLKRD